MLSTPTSAEEKLGNSGKVFFPEINTHTNLLHDFATKQ